MSKPSVPANPLPGAAGAHEVEPGSGLPFLERGEFEMRLRDAAIGAASGVPHALLVVHLERCADAIAQCGPEAGFALTGLVRRVLGQQLGPGTCCCPTGAERFALLKERCLPRDAVILARRIQGALGGGVFRWEGRSFRLRAGVCVVELGDDLGGPDEILGRATKVCLAALSLGNDGVLALEGDRDHERDQESVIEREREWRDHIREVLG